MNNVVVDIESTKEAPRRREDFEPGCLYRGPDGFIGIWSDMDSLIDLRTGESFEWIDVNTPTDDEPHFLIPDGTTITIETNY